MAQSSEKSSTISVPVVQPLGREQHKRQGQQEASTHCQVGVLVSETVAAAVPLVQMPAQNKGLQVLHHRDPKRDNVERERNATLWNSPSAEEVPSSRGPIVVHLVVMSQGLQALEVKVIEGAFLSGAGRKRHFQTKQQSVRLLFSNRKVSLNRLAQSMFSFSGSDERGISIPSSNRLDCFSVTERSL